jgi:hypothetical protein
VAVVISLTACTALGSSNYMSDSSQVHDLRMRMRHGQLMDVKPTNYGTRAVMMEQYPTMSVPANRATTKAPDQPAAPTHGNATPQVMPAASARPQPAPTAGNMPAEPWFKSWNP